MYEAEWIYDGGRMMITYRYKCSACFQRSIERTNFCPHCGARMRNSNENLRKKNLSCVREGVRGDDGGQSYMLEGVPKEEK